MSYCNYCSNLEDLNLHKVYHDQHYGLKIDSDNELFGRLILEINQAGLSWNTILMKQENFRNAFDQYDISKIAKYDEEKINSLLQDAGIIRNKLKVHAVIYNAQQIIKLQNEFGSFKNWIEQHHPLIKDEWVKLFKKNFKFVGGEIVKEFLMSTSYLEGAHEENCPIFHKMKILNSSK